VLYYRNSWSGLLFTIDAPVELVFIGSVPTVDRNFDLLVPIPVIELPVYTWKEGRDCLAVVQPITAAEFEISERPKAHSYQPIPNIDDRDLSSHAARQSQYTRAP
jgi:hypothetical protein